LLNTKAGKKSSLITPEPFRKDKEYLIHTSYHESKSGADPDSLDSNDNDLKGTLSPSTYCDGCCGYMEFNNPYEVNAKGIFGLIDVFESVFIDSGMAKVLYEFEPRQSKPVGFDDNIDRTVQNG